MTFLGDFQSLPGLLEQAPPAPCKAAFRPPATNRTATRHMAELSKKYDVLVAGGGNAAMCAAVAAARAGARVLVVEAAAKFYRGGNTRHTRNIRCAHDAGTAKLSCPYPGEESFQETLHVTQG